MKTSKLFGATFLLFAFVFSSCSSLIECETVVNRRLILEADVSDPRLFKEIESDLNSNFPGFMQRTALGNITACQSFTLSFAHLSAKDALDISSASIAISRRNQSVREEQSQANPAPLIKLMHSKLDEYRLLAGDSAMTAGSNIANVLLKTIIQTNPDEETHIVVFSDLVENNAELNLYKKIPSIAQVPQVIEQMIDPGVLDKFWQLQKQGVKPKVIVVMKSEPGGKTNQRAVKTFWVEVFKELKIDVQFVDNLSNEIAP